MTLHELLRPLLRRRDFVVAGLGAAVVASQSKRLGQQALAAGKDQAPVTRPLGPGSVKVRLLVNGADHDLTIDPRVTLLDAMRNELGLTGSKKGCDHGQCGACTMLVGGRRINSCLTLALRCTGKQVVTIEGLANGDQLHPMQAAFLERDAFQCGYCTPGQIVSAVGLLGEPCGNDAESIRECMSGNICRCGAYPNIVAAISDIRGGGSRHARL